MVKKKRTFFCLLALDTLAHEGDMVMMKENDAYQMVKISRAGRDGVDMDQCPAYGVVGNK